MTDNQSSDPKRITKKLDKFYIILLTFGLIFLSFIGYEELRIGTRVDSFQGVPVYYNSFFNENVDGVNYSKDGYYYGLKWQCVEFVQRFYYDKLNHSMPDPTKNARDYFEPSVPEGERNKITGLRQFKNGGSIAPAERDILVFVGGKYGHVALITKVDSAHVEIIQQNVYGETRVNLSLERKKNSYKIISANQVAGWLRK